MIDRELHIGVVSEPRIVDVEAGFLKFFAKATGETNPIYFDEAAAQDAGHPTIPMPPTYLFSLHRSHPARRGDVLDKDGGIGVDMARVLHGEQGFIHHRPIYAGERITITTTTDDIYDKKDGALEFVVKTSCAVNQHDELVAEMRTVLVCRH